MTRKDKLQYHLRSVRYAGAKSGGKRSFVKNRRTRVKTASMFVIDLLYDVSL